MAQEIMNLPIAALKPHHRNEEFFSNIEGEDFKRLKESISELGILTPLRVAADMTIVSGHQRYRAAKELGLELVPVIVDHTLQSDDGMIAQLIAANFGRMKNDPIKQAKWIAEYERVRGVKVGRPNKSGNNVRISQEDIAAELGVDTRTLRNLKSLNTLLPEIQDIISEGRVSATTGFKLITSLSPEEQRKLLESLPETEKITAKKMEACIAEVRGTYEAKVSALEDTVRRKSDEVIGLQNAQVEAQNQRDQKLQEEKRKYYENWQIAVKGKQAAEDEVKKLQGDLETARENARKANLRAALKESPEGMQELESKIHTLEATIESLTEQLKTAEEKIETASQNENDGFLRYAIPDIADARQELEDVSSVCVRVQTALGSYLTDVRSINRELTNIPELDSDFASILLDTVSDVISETKILYGTLSSKSSKSA